DQAVVDEAVAVTSGTAGRAIFFSALSVLLGVVGLLLFDFMILRSIGIAGGVVMALGMAAALTLLPAVLSYIGPRIDALTLRRTHTLPDAEGPWARFARRVMERPWQVLLPTLGLLLLLGWPFLHARVNAPDATILPPDVPSRQAYDLLVREFGEGDFAPLLLAIRTDGPVTSVDNVGRLYDWSRRLAADPRVSGVDGIVDIDPRLTRLQYQLLLGSPAGIPDRFTATFVGAAAKGDLTAFLVTTPYGPNHDAARALVMELRDPASPLAPPEGMELLVAGGAAEVADVVDRIRDQFPRSALIIVLATYGVLFVLLRSVILPLKALAMNTLSILASFGALVWIFQDGNLSAVLGFQPLGFVETTAPVILFCVLFGLSMDYEVFLLARMKEVWDRTGDNREAVARGLERSGRIVTSAALIVFVVAGSFAAAEIVLIKALGVGVAIAVALDATVVRALLVPATMRLLGDRNWWLPGPVRRFLDRRLPLVETVALLLVVALAAGCGPDGRVLAVPPTEPPPTPPAVATMTPPADPMPLSFPADDGSHGRLTEWWYYTGHLRSGDGRRFGFEYVVFRAERGDFPVAWASHLALTDESAGTFRYDQRNEIGPQVDRSRPGTGFDLSVLARDDSGVAAPGATSWTMRGADGRDQLAAESITGAFGLSLALDDGTRPPVLHDGDGFVDFGPGGTSYYYSRTRMAARGNLVLGGRTLPVEGTAWFDHQWGDFITVGGTGWDWFAVNLEDGTDVTLSLVRGLDGRVVIAYGTFVRPDGRAVHLAAGDFEVQTLGRWQSPNTGADYPSGWLVRLPAEKLEIELTPTVADQELDTRATTGVVYWEGSQRVRATRAGRVLGGEAYVELTGYAGGLPGDVAP
ncbi:MAG TPA: MMPL family transporter, partial [Candidatus Limnocylindrales bacterium]|nr:MMPL family transporter [Candidatus Limnocylindrales bacterium]